MDEGPIGAFLDLLRPEARREFEGGLPPHGRELAERLLRPLAEGRGPLSREEIVEEMGRVQADPAAVKDLMEGRVTLLGGISPQTMGTPMDWFLVPGGDWQWPTHLSRHYWLLPLAYAYRATGEARYAERVLAVVDDFVENASLGTPGLDRTVSPWARHLAERPAAPGSHEGMFPGYQDGPWTSLSCHARLEWWSRILQLLWDSPSLTNARVARLLGSLAREHVGVMLDFPRQMNQFQAVASGLVEFGLQFPEFSVAAEAEQVGWKRLERYASREIYPDGSVAECSPNYGVMCVQRLAHLILRAEAAGRSVPSLLGERVSLATRYFALTSDPRGWSPRIAKGGQPLRARLAELNRFGQDGEVRFISSGGAEGGEPSAKCRSFDWAGHQVFRSGWGEHDLWLFFESGPRGTGHHDNAQLSLQLAVGEETLLADPGYYSYSVAGREGLMSAYLRSTAAHNAALVDGQGQKPYPTGTVLLPNSAPGDYGWRDDAFSAEARGVYAGGFGADGEIQVRHRRRVVFLKEEKAFRVEDRFEGEGEHQIDLRWQAPPGRAVTSSPSGFAIQGRKACLRGEVLSAGAPVEITRHGGEAEPLLGWYSEGYGKVEASTTVQVRFRATLPCEIVTRLSVLPPTH